MTTQDDMAEAAAEQVRAVTPPMSWPAPTTNGDEAWIAEQAREIAEDAHNAACPDAHDESCAAVIDLYTIVMRDVLREAMARGERREREACAIIARDLFQRCATFRDASDAILAQELSRECEAMIRARPAREG